MRPQVKLLSCLIALSFTVCYIVFNAVPEKDLKTSTSQVQYISECQCSRKWMYPPTEDEQAVKTGSHQFKRFDSSCSDEGTHYQTAQNVITFSVFYPQNFTNVIPVSSPTSPINYQIGLFENLQMMRKYYPGYSLRLYTSLPLRPREYFCDLLCLNTDFFWCDIRKTPGHGDLSRMNFRTWRFLVMGDPTVNIFHSRDLDSLISYREVAVVKDWLFNSPKGHKPIMLMRDKKNGHNVAMLAGMWGADNVKLAKAKELQKQIILQSQLESSQNKTFDQKFLENEIFHPMAKDIVAYDSHTCVNWSNFTEIRPFPVKRKDPATDFVGNRVDFQGGVKPWVYGIVECPLECRPSYGRDWIYC